MLKPWLGFGYRESIYLFWFLKVQYVLDIVHVESSDFKTAIQFSTSIRSGQESWRIYLNETGKRSPHGGKKALKKDCYRTTLLCQSTLLLTEAMSQGLLTLVWLKTKGIKFNH